MTTAVFLAATLDVAITTALDEHCAGSDSPTGETEAISGRVVLL